MENFNKYILSDKAVIKDALIALDCLSGDIQTLFILNDRNQLIGTVTDGDIRRGLINGKAVTDNIKEVFFPDFKYITEEDKDVLKIRQFRKNNVELLPCLNSNKQIIKVYDLKSNKSLADGIDSLIMSAVLMIMFALPIFVIVPSAVSAELIFYFLMILVAIYVAIALGSIVDRLKGVVIDDTVTTKK